MCGIERVIVIDGQPGAKTRQSIALMNDEAEPTINLDQFLKFADLVDTGGEAKRLIQSGAVAVNGETETRRRRKLRQNDVVTLDGDDFTVQFED